MHAPRAGDRTALVATVLIVALVLPAAPIQAAPQKITGKVLATDGVAPVKGVSVIFQDQRTGQVYEADPTDAEGIYRVSDLPDGDYKVTVRAAGKSFEQPKEVSIRGGQPTTLSVILTPEATEAALADTAAGKTGKKGKTLAIILSAVGAAVIAGLAAAGGDDEEDREGSPHKP